jgi:hypothetical protein
MLYRSFGRLAPCCALYCRVEGCSWKAGEDTEQRQTGLPFERALSTPLTGMWLFKTKQDSERSAVKDREMQMIGIERRRLCRCSAFLPFERVLSG